MPIAKYFSDSTPIGPLVEIYPNPPTRPYVRRRKKSVRVQTYKQILIHVRGLHPHARPAGTVVIVRGRVHREQFVANTKGRLAPRFDFVRFREG